MPAPRLPPDLLAVQGRVNRKVRMAPLSGARGSAKDYPKGDGCLQIEQRGQEEEHAQSQDVVGRRDERPRGEGGVNVDPV